MQSGGGEFCPVRHISSSGFRNASIYTTAYTRFSGCAFLADESTVGDAYSPDCVNMIPDVSGFPEKRVGWRVLHAFDGAAVHGIHAFQCGDDTVFIVHAGTRMHLYNPAEAEEQVTVLFDGAAEHKSFSFPYGGALYLLDGVHYLCFDGKRIFPVGDGADGSLDSCTAFVPTTTILRRPDGGGTIYQKVNMLTRWRKNTFITDGSSVDFVVDAGRIDSGSAVYAVDLDSVQTFSADDFSVDYDTGTIHFFKTPAAASIEGTQRLEITFACTPSTDYAGLVTGCTFAALYGYDAANRVFIAGNPDSRNMLYYSENNNPTYFADLNYIEIGVSNFAITGFLKTAAGELAVLKEPNESEATIWHVSAQISADESIGGAYFPVREGVSGVGCVSPFTPAQLKNDALFLGSFGVYNLATSYTMAKYMSNIVMRSDPVNYRLLHDAGLSSAVACVWENRYLLFLGGHVYVMTTDRNWWYWDNVPADCVCSAAGFLLFGTADGRLCRFNTDMTTDKGALRMSAFNDDGAAITARWTTKVSADGDFFRQKNLEKNGFGVYIKTYPRTSVTVSVRPLDGAKRYLKQFSKSRFSFDDLDFRALDFTTQATYTCPIRARLRGYSGLQVVLENAEINQAFGISQILYRYTVGNYLRR